ncbi:MAG: hypothetical protein OXI70_08590 [Chloroflexota bacterium]|nr:hypothetical protein [Bryobacterales bacterium]MDE2768133.1 hypothetical protein [Chloroflexota bacterium]
MKPARLFDYGIDRSTSHEHWRGASRFDSLNRSDMPAMQTARAELERWYSRFCDSDGDLRARFRSPKKDQSHDGAFFELFLHELLKRLGLSVKAHPTLDVGSRPDFLVSGSAGKAYVEATYLSQQSAVPPLEAKVLNAIDNLNGRVPADLGLYVRFTGTLTQAPKTKCITDRICQWLCGLPSQAVSWESSHTMDMPVDPKYGNWKLMLEAVPRSQGASVIVAWESGSKDASISDHLYKAVSEKASKYKNLDHPLVVAVNIPGNGAELAEESALFGQRALRLRRSASSVEWTSEGLIRTGKALWFDNTKRCHHYPWLSAVMMFHNLAPWTVANVSACLYLNPYVDDRVPRELRTLGYAAAVDGDLRRFKGGRSVRDVLGLSEDWPGSFGLGD